MNTQEMPLVVMIGFMTSLEPASATTLPSIAVTGVISIPRESSVCS